MGDFDGLRAAVAAGDGVVARFPGIVAVAEFAASDEIHLRRLLDICREAGGSAPGRSLARRLATWLGGVDGPPDSVRFGTLSATGDDGLAVFCFGAVSMVTGGDGTAATTISGTDSAAWADRLVPRPDSSVLLTLDGTDVTPESASVLYDLRSGVVPGSAVAMLAASDTRPVTPAEAALAVPSLPSPEPRAPAQAAPEETPPGEAAPDRAAPDEEPPTQFIPAAPVPPPGPDPETLPRAPRRSEPIFGAPPEESRPPLDSGGSAGTVAAHGPSTDESSDTDGQAQGHLCSRGHLNDPRSHFCVLCGIRMNQQTGVLVIGSRPPLGLLVFDDGTTYTVDAEYLVGRMPEGDERVVSGSLRPISVEDSSGAVSRVHAEVRLDGWDVLLVDSGSRNGTFLAPPGDENWTQLPPRESRRLEPGTRVRLGGRTFIFESPSGVR